MLIVNCAAAKKGSERMDETRPRSGVSEVTTHLKDLNVFDKTKLPPVIHGRKASTYLRIFQDDEQHTGQPDEPEAPVAPSIDWNPSFTKKSFRSPCPQPRRRHSSSIYDTLTRIRRNSARAINVPPLLTNRQARHADKAAATIGQDKHNTHAAEELHAYPSHHPSGESCTGPKDPVTRPQEEVSSTRSLELKPISSATYYPHKSNDRGAGNDAARRPSVTTVASVESSTKHDNDNTTDEDDEEDGFIDEEYPLAVELKPFTNKVGGHTAIFRFSERAVCKALVNRENRWYENIEQQHKDLLQFMPRYIGVLNVRQHFNSKDEFMKEIELNKQEKLEQKKKNKDYVLGAPLKHVQSLPAPDEHLEYKNPEVVLDDNKHIIPDSLWFRYSHSPNSVPSDSYLSSHSLEDRKTHIRDSGSTVINTKLQELVLQEVFAPTKRKCHSRAPSLGGKHKSRSSSSSSVNSQYLQNIRRNSAESRPSSIPPSSPLLHKSVKSSIANAVDSHASVLDLKQFNKRKMAQEHLERDKIDCTTSNEELLPDSPAGDEGVFSMEEDAMPSKDDLGHESVSIEENSHTIVSKFILLEDLTRKLNKPCVLDLKMGTRQYGVDAKRSKQLSQREKCRKTTSRKLGVRICGLKIWNKSYYITRDKYFGRRVRIGWQFARVLGRFLYNGETKASILEQIPRLITQLDKLYAEISTLKGYRLYGSSLLLMYDGNNPNNKRCRVKVNLIDFAQCITSDDLREGEDSFKVPPKRPELEDRGFLRGIRSLKFYLVAMWNHLTNDAALCFDDDLTNLLQDQKSVLSQPWDWLDEFDKESEADVNDPKSELRKKWRKYELIFGVEPRYQDDPDISE